MKIIITFSGRLLLLLIIVARVRGGGSYADDYEEPVVTLPTFEPAPSANSFGSATFESSPPAAGTLSAYSS